MKSIFELLLLLICFLIDHLTHWGPDSPDGLRMGPPHLRWIVGRAGDVVEEPERERFVVVVPGEKLSDGPVIGGRFITHKNAVGADVLRAGNGSSCSSLRRRLQRR